MTKVSFTEIGQAAKGLLGTCESLRGQLQRIEAIKEKLKTAWTDTTQQQLADKYLEQVEAQEASLRATIEMFEDLPRTLSDVLNEYMG